MTKNKPKPLDLNELVKKVYSLCVVYNDLEINKLRNSIKKEIKQRLKSACEFFLRYKDKPELLVKEHPEYEKEIERICLSKLKKNVLRFLKKIHPDYASEPYLIDIHKYNEWLFKLAFKSVLDEEKNDTKQNS